MKYLPIHSTRPVRRLRVVSKSNYSHYKGELREDFIKTCGYCGTPDFYSGGRAGFHIDHFAPKSKFAHLKNTYTNLVYACPICNIGKSNDWPGDDPAVSFVADSGYVDPCDPQYHVHLARSEDGKIVPLTQLGQYICKKLKLHLRRRQIIWLMEKMQSQQVALSEVVKAKGATDAKDEMLALCELVQEYSRYMGILRSE
jgi:hypothetical protein